MATAPFMQKTLKDLVTGIRAHKGSEAKYVNSQLSEIRKEVRKSDIRTKVIGIQKLTYLYMLGYDVSWAAFNMIEVMSNPKLYIKKIGYLAATQSFDENTEVVLLLGNLLKKDMGSKDMFAVALALDCLANLVTEELANVLVTDVYELLNSSSSYIRKKSVLVLYKMFLRYPDALRPSFKRLQDKLNDSDNGVVVAAVTVMTELAMRNPKNYLPLAPMFFRLLQENNSGNWMMIKLVKLFGLLAPHEPRLLKKLSSPMLALMERTTAKSLLYECMNTITSGLRNNEDLVNAALKRVNEFVYSQDQNLKYLGLKVLRNLGTSYPNKIWPYKEIIVKSLSDIDVTIQSCALKLIVSMITPSTLPELVTTLLKLIVRMNVSDNEYQRKYRDELVYAVLDVCSKDRYSMLEDFGQYLRVLADLARLAGRPHGYLIGEQMVDITVRVEEVRPESLEIAFGLLTDYSLFEQGLGNVNKWNFYSLQSSAWIVGELSRLIPTGKKRSVIETLLRPEVGTLLPPSSQVIYLTAALKVYGSITTIEEGEEGMDNDSFHAICHSILQSIHCFERSGNVDVRDRASEFAAILHLDTAGNINNGSVGNVCRSDIGTIFSDYLNPVSIKAQGRVPIPEGLSFNLSSSTSAEDGVQSAAESELSESSPIISTGDNNAIVDDDDDEDDDEEEDGENAKTTSEAAKMLTKKSKKDLAKAQEQAREQLNKHRQRHDMFYLDSDRKEDKSKEDDRHISDVTEPEVVEEVAVYHDLKDLDTSGVDMKPTGLIGLASGFTKRRSTSGSPVTIKDDETLPAPEKISMSTGNGETSEDPLNVDLTSPLSADEKLPSLQHYPRSHESNQSPAWVDTNSRDTRSEAQGSNRPGNEDGQGTEKKKHRKHRHKHKEGQVDGADETEKRRRRKHKHKRKEEEDIG